jgi:hypothetical protein
VGEERLWFNACGRLSLATITLARTPGLGLKSSPDRHRLPSQDRPRPTNRTTSALLPRSDIERKTAVTCRHRTTREGEPRCDGRREQHWHALGLPLVPCRDQAAGVFKDLRLGRALRCRFLWVLVLDEKFRVRFVLRAIRGRDVPRLSCFGHELSPTLKSPRCVSRLYSTPQLLVFPARIKIQG